MRASTQFICFVFFVAFVLMMVFIWGCEAPSDAREDPKPLRPDRFVVVEVQDITSWEAIKVVRDTKTNVEYIMVVKPEGIGICRLENGQ